MAMGACPGQIPMPCVPPALMVTATMVRACRYICFRSSMDSVRDVRFSDIFVDVKDFTMSLMIFLTVRRHRLQNQKTSLHIYGCKLCFW